LYVGRKKSGPEDPQDIHAAESYIYS